MDIFFTENRFFKEDILLTEDFLFARAIVCLCAVGLLVISCLGTYGARQETVWPLAVVRMTIKTNVKKHILYQMLSQAALAWKVFLRFKTF